jgi:steroid 5-alpha reductase family enzyme
VSVPTLVAAGWIVAAVVMAALWAWSVRLQNAGVVDVGWTALVGGLAVFDAAMSPDGMAGRRVAIAAMMGIWSARLTVFLLVDRVFGKPEDGRYAELRRARGAGASSWFFWFFQAQAIAAVFFSIPALLSAPNPSPKWHPLEFAAMAIWVVAFAGEVTADQQLLAFKTNPNNRGKTCQAGWWRYSRHPNYFFEWLIWVAYALFASAAPWGWLAWLCPATLLYLLFKVTGIPATEAQALRSRGEAYRRYQQTTSAFVPWFPKQPA